MPIRDPERRKEVSKAWRKRSTPEYHKWLYERRKFRFDTAESAVLMLEIISKSEHPLGLLARDWLADRLEQEKLVGNAFDHERNVAIWLTLP